MHDQTIAENAAFCEDLNSCTSNPLGYATQGLKYPTTVGIAKDGHLIVGPFKDTNKLWQPCDVDACNGVYLGSPDDNMPGSYVYAMTMFFPYTVGCWGPANQVKFTPSCSSRTEVCGSFAQYGYVFTGTIVLILSALMLVFY